MFTLKFLFSEERRQRASRLTRCRVLIISVLSIILAKSHPALAQSPVSPQPAQQQADGQPDLVNPDRPGIADGSTVIGARRFQLETGYQNEFRSDTGNTERRIYFPTLLRFGISKSWEGRIEGNTYTFTRTTTPGMNPVETSGLSPLSFGFKYHFQDQTAVGKHASLGTIFRLFPASGSSDFKTNHTTFDWRLAADWDFTPNLSLNPNIGIGLYEDDQGRTFASGLFAVTLNYFNHNRTINPFLDLGLQAPEERDGKSSLIIDAGIAFILGHNVQLDFSVGTGSLGRTPPHPFLSAGVSIRF